MKCRVEIAVCIASLLTFNNVFRLHCPTIRIARSCRPHPSQIESLVMLQLTSSQWLQCDQALPLSAKGVACKITSFNILVGTETASSRLVLRPLCRHGNETILVRLFTLDCKRSPFSLSFCQAIHGITVASSQITPIVTCAN